MQMRYDDEDDNAKVSEVHKTVYCSRIVTAIAMQASATYGERRSPVRIQGKPRVSRR